MDGYCRACEPCTSSSVNFHFFVLFHNSLTDRSISIRDELYYKEKSEKIDSQDGLLAAMCQEPEGTTNPKVSLDFLGADGPMHLVVGTTYF